MISATLPGSELIGQGLDDIAAGAVTIESLLVAIAAPRLRTLGYSVPTGAEHPELRLYELLATQYGNGAHNRYNALIRRVVSFQRAAACAR
jgi:hypothetical protein